MKILLMGNPNVGKSVIFSRLTGAHVVSSNYPGTTVGFTKGRIWIEGNEAEIIDVPGIYRLEPLSRADEVAVKMLAEGDIIINVVDATNLERSLYLTMQLMERGIPMVLALNMWDDVKHKGINLDLEKLREFLQVPIIPTVAVAGEGIKELVAHISQARAPHVRQHSDEERWVDIGKIIMDVQLITHRHHTFLEKISDASLMPHTGIPLAILILLLCFAIIRFLGESLIHYVMDPFFYRVYGPWIIRLVKIAFPSGMMYNILIGNSTNFIESLGLLTTGLYVPLGMVLPYIFSFYLILGILEDVGYLPRLAVLADTIMHRVGLHGFAIISIVLGLGCNVPGALSTRVLETRREKFIASTLLCISVPCMAQSAMIIGLVGRYGLVYVFLVYGILMAIGIVTGTILDKVLKGGSPEIFMEIPSYHVPHLGALIKKLRVRVFEFLDEAVPLVLLGIFIINVLNAIGVMKFISLVAAPVATKVWGLPQEVVPAMIIGFLRKDVAVGMLEPLHLSVKQLVTASTILTVYFPCVATFFILLKELGLKDMIKASLIMVAVAITIGGMINFLWW
ncbi:MAG: ferrous iron transporter B [bacterium]